MESHCPVCGNVLPYNRIVCPSCEQRIDARRPQDRSNALLAWGQGLMLCMAIFFFLKGAYGALSPEEYGRAMKAFGLPVRDVEGTSLTAVFFLAAGLLYGIAYMGGYLERAWGQYVCLAALVVFIAGEMIVQFLILQEAGGIARAMALFLFWIAAPILQYCMYRMGLAEIGAPPPGEEI
ncbi:DUF2116 family Zn-ribbon domain-containing protein [bacterium]|nr:DUF2116 family Zn-ribbon domain-containing protein [bacterium]